MQKQMLAYGLTFAGALPFLGGLYLHIKNASFMGLDADTIILTYGAIIASFIAGIHWGIYLFKDGPFNLFVHSNLIALLSWAALLWAIPGSAGILLIAFLYMLFLDKQLHTAGILQDWYLRMRIIVTLIVCSALSAYLILP